MTMTLPAGYSIEEEYGDWYASGPADSTIAAETFSSEAEAIAACIADAAAADDRAAETAERIATRIDDGPVPGSTAASRGARAAMTVAAEQDERASRDRRYAIERAMAR